MKSEIAQDLSLDKSEIKNHLQKAVLINLDGTLTRKDNLLNIEWLKSVKKTVDNK